MNGFRFTTESGTVYEINRDAMTWTRIQSTPRSGKTRRDDGKLVCVPEITVGHCALLQDNDIRPGCDTHFVMTTPVVSVSEILT